MITQKKQKKEKTGKIREKYFFRKGKKERMIKYSLITGFSLKSRISSYLTSHSFPSQFYQTCNSLYVTHTAQENSAIYRRKNYFLKHLVSAIYYTREERIEKRRRWKKRRKDEKVEVEENVRWLGSKRISRTPPVMRIVIQFPPRGQKLL